MELKIINKIGLSILLLGLINLYNIVKYGIVFYIPSLGYSTETLYYDKSKKMLYQILEGGLIKIDINNLKVIIFITLIIFIIFNISSNELFSEKIFREKDKSKSLEYELLIGLGLLGLIWIEISNDIISLYLGLELYSFSIYILILVKESITIRRISIIYLILSSLISGILLYTFSIIYKNFGILNLDKINIIINNTTITKEDNIVIIYLILLALLFKLGAIPFSYWLIRLYADLEKRILWYQLTIPKFIFFILLIKLLIVFNNIETFKVSFSYILYIIALLSISIGAIGGLFQRKDNLLLSYSSILNIGFILLALTLLIFENNLISSLNIFKDLNNIESLWTLYQYFILYIINLIGLFASLFLYSRTSLVFNFRTFFSHPYFFISFLIHIFSFIGLPPTSGFFSKFYLLFALYSYSIFTILSYVFFLFFTLISSFFYFKFLFSSSSFSSTIFIDNKNTNNNKLSLASLVLGGSSLFSISYPLLLSYLIPLFYFFM